MFDSYESTVGERIRYYRNRAGLTQKAVAEACGLTEPAIRNYELGNRIPTNETLEDIAAALHISYFSLADPNLGALYGVMHSLFRMEYAHGLMPVEQDGRAVLMIDPNYQGGEGSFLQQMMNQWLEARKKLDSGEWTLEQYEDWEVQYPEYTVNSEAMTVKVETSKRKRPRKNAKKES